MVSTKYCCRRRRRVLGGFVTRGKLAIARLLGARLRLSRVFNGTFVFERFKIDTRTKGRSRFLLPEATRCYHVFNFPLGRRPPTLNNCIRSNSLVGVKGVRLGTLTIPNRSPKDVIFCYRTRRYVFDNSMLFQNDVKHTSLRNKGFSRLERDVITHLLALPSRAVMCPNRKGPAAVNCRGVGGPFFH